MFLLIQFFGAKLPELLFFQSYFEVHTISKELTPIGWIIVIALPLALIFGIVIFITKFLKKSK